VGIQILGAAEAPAEGMNKGSVTSIEDAVSSISHALESVERMRFQEKIAVTPMTVCAVLGGIGNYLQHRILLQGAPNLTRKGMQWHILSDLWQSVAVVLTGLLIAATGKPEIDLVASIMIAAAMLFGGCRLIFWAKNSHEHYD